jgi:DNA-binding NarL/FixJ family response regulator
MKASTVATDSKPAARRIRVLIAEDHIVVREGLRALLEAEPDIEVIGEAENGRQILHLADKMNPSVVLMDIAMPVLNGLEAARQMRKNHPNIRILVLSAHGDDAYVEQMMSLGARGYLLKQTSFQQLAKAIREVDKGNTYFSSAIVHHFRDKDWRFRVGGAPAKTALSRLSSRESEVLQLIAESKSNKQVASILGISIKTVEKHRQNLMDKLDVHDTAGLTRYAISAGVIESSVQLTIR